MVFFFTHSALIVAQRRRWLPRTGTAGLLTTLLLLAGTAPLFFTLYLRFHAFELLGEAVGIGTHPREA